MEKKQQTLAAAVAAVETLQGIEARMAAAESQVDTSTAAIPGMAQLAVLATSSVAGLNEEWKEASETQNLAIQAALAAGNELSEIEQATGLKITRD